MVSYAEVKASNGRISSSLPAGLVAVFVGATSGIGEMTLKEFAKHARKPRVYFSGRSEEAGKRITAECKALNPEGEFIFMPADLSLIQNVDKICQDIQSKEKSINLLFLTMGSLAIGKGKRNYILICSWPNGILFFRNFRRTSVRRSSNSLLPNSLYGQSLTAPPKSYRPAPSRHHRLWDQRRRTRYG